MISLQKYRIAMEKREDGLSKVKRSRKRLYRITLTSTICCCSVAQLRLMLRDPTDSSTPPLQMPVILRVCPAREAGHSWRCAPLPLSPEEGTRVQSRAPVSNAAEIEARGPAGRASTSPDLAHTRALLPRWAALGSPGMAATEPPFIP